MKLIKASYNILESKGLFKDIEIAARTCYKSEDKITDDSADKIVKSLIERKHTAMLEHGTVYLHIPYKGYRGNSSCKIAAKYQRNKYSKVIEGYRVFDIVTNYRVLVENNWLKDLQYQCEPNEFHEKRISIRFTCDRGVSHEFVRHRAFSFAQESTRYCNYSKDKFGNELTFIIPSWIDISDGNYFYNDRLFETSTPEEAWFDSMICNEDSYKFLIEHGYSAQQARAVLPNSLKTELVMTGFISDWKGFFILRDATTAHPQAFELAHPLHEEFKQLNLL